MHIIKRKTLVEFYNQPSYLDSKSPLEAWYYEAKNANWSSSADIKRQYRSASILKNHRVVFNIAGNKYRLVVRINYYSKTIFVIFSKNFECRGNEEYTENTTGPKPFSTYYLIYNSIILIKYYQ